MTNQCSVAEATYRRHSRNLQQWVGWFALVRGDRLGGVFPTHAAAAAAWMAMYGPVPALIRRIERVGSTTAEPAVPPTSPARSPRVDRPPADPPLAVACNWALPAVGRGPRKDYAA